MIDDSTLARILPEVCRIAGVAGAEIMRFYEQGAAKRTKPDGSPVTEADLASDALIVPVLERLLPGVPVVSEERPAPDVSGGTFWLVDPLDGTAEFVGRTGQFTVLIGLVREGEPVLGVIQSPPTGVLYAAAGAGSVVRIEGGRATPIAARAVPEEGLTVISSRTRPGGPVAQLIERVKEDRPVAAWERFGSAFKFGELASGRADLYPCLGHSYEWDTAAGHAILNAAGGRVETLDGGTLRYGKPDFRNPHFLAWGRDEIGRQGAKTPS